MEKKSLLSAKWLKAAFLLVVLCLSGVNASANTTQTPDLVDLVPGETYTIDANTMFTGRYFGEYDGTITLTSSVSAGTNLIPYTDKTYTKVIETVRDESAKTRTFVFSGGNRGSNVYFKSVVSTTPYEVKFDFVRSSNLEDYLESITPEADTEVESLKDFTLTFTTKIYGVKDVAKIYKGETLVAEKELEYAANVNTYSFSLDQAISEPGEYTLVFPEGAFTCSSNMKASSEWKFNYTIADKSPHMVVSIVGGATEAEAVTLNNLNGSVTIKNTTASIVSEWTQVGLFSIPAGAPADFAGTCYVEYTVTEVSDTEFTLTPNADQLANLNTEKAYKFKIPEGYFKYADGSKSAAYETWVKYEEPSFDPVTIAFSPASGTEDVPAEISLDDFSNITITLTGAESIAISNAALSEETCIFLRLWNNYYQDYDNAIAFKPELVEGTTYKLVPFDQYWASLLPMLEAGKYEVRIPAGTFVYNGVETNVNPTTSAYYKLVLPTYSIYPEANSVIQATDTEGLSAVQVRFNNESMVTPSETVTATLKRDAQVVEEGIMIQTNWAKKNTAVIAFSKVYTEAGEYEVVLPEGYVTLGSGAAAEAMTIKYTVVGAVVAEPTLVVTPAGGTEDAPAAIEAFEFVIKAENASKLDYDVNGYISICGWGEGRGGEGYVNAFWPTFTRIDDTTVKLTIDGYTVEEMLDLTVGGKFQLSIPAGDMWFNGDSALKCEETVLYYVYGDGSTNAPEVVLTPAVGSTVSSIEDGTITFEVKNATEVTINPLVLDWQNDVCLLIDPSGTWIMVYPVAIEGETNKFKFVPFDEQPQYPFTTEGTYQIYIPTGAFSIDGVEFEGLYEEKYITVGATNEPAMVVTPANGSAIESYEDIRISFENVQKVEINPNSLNVDFGKIMLVADDNWMTAAIAKPVAVEGETNVFALELIDGQLSSFSSLFLYMEEGTFWMDGADSPTIEYTYTASSAPEVVLTPAVGSTVSSIEDGTITFEVKNATEVTINPLVLDWQNDVCLLIDPSGTWIMVYPVAIEGETNKFKFVPFDEQPQYPFTAEGTYQIYIPTGAFVIDGVEFEGLYEEKYITVAAPGEPAMVVTPEAGTTVKAFTSDVVTISFENVKEVTINEVALTETGCKITITTPSGSWKRVMPQAIEGETNKFRLVNFDGTDFNLTEEGSYALWINGMPGPAFYMDGVANPMYYEEKYITVAPYSYIAEPAEGAVASLETVALTFDPAIQSIKSDATGNVVLYKDNVEVETVPVSELKLVGWGAAASQTLAMEFSKAYTEGGEYKVVVPAGVVELAGGATNKEITLKYFISGISSNWTAVADPAPGVVEEITTIMVTFEGASQITVAPDAGPNDFPYYATVAEDGTLTKVPYSVFAFVEDKNVVSLTVQNEEAKLSAPGKYAFIIPASYCTVDGGAMTEDLRFDYTIEGAQPEYNVVINPADGSTVNGEDLYVITVTFEGAKSIELSGDYATTLYQIDEAGNEIASVYQTNSVEGNVAKFTVMELHKPYLDVKGRFQFTIPVGMVTITDNNDVVGKNKDNIVATYDSNGTSIDTIGVDAKDLNIYSVNGMLIKRNGTYEDVKALQPGIYIINGKKFYVK